MNRKLGQGRKNKRRGRRAEKFRRKVVPFSLRFLRIPGIVLPTFGLKFSTGSYAKSFAASLLPEKKETQYRRKWEKYVCIFARLPKSLISSSAETRADIVPRINLITESEYIPPDRENSDIFVGVSDSDIADGCLLAGWFDGATVVAVDCTNWASFRK